MIIVDLEREYQDLINTLSIKDISPITNLRSQFENQFKEKNSRIIDLEYELEAHRKSNLENSQVISMDK